MLQVHTTSLRVGLIISLINRLNGNTLGDDGEMKNFDKGKSSDHIVI